MNKGFSARSVAPERLSPGDRMRWADWTAKTPGLDSAFLSFPYVLTASRFFHHVRVAVIERDGETVGFFPYQFNDRYHRWLRFAERVGGDLSDYFGIVGAPGLSLSSPQLLRLAGLNGLFFTHLDEAQAAYGLDGGQPETGLRIVLTDGPESYWRHLKEADKKFVSDTERRERKLVNKHGPLRLTFRHDQPLKELDSLIARKREQYAHTGVGDPLVRTTTRAFLEALAENDDPLCRGTVSTLYAGDTWVASHFGLMHRGTLHFWFPVYNADLQPFSPGRMLMVAIIRSAADLGVTTIDRGAGTSQAKRDFANAEHLFYQGLWLRATPSAQLIRVDMALRWRLNDWRQRVAASHP